MPPANRITVILTSGLCLLLLASCKPAQTAKGPAAMPIVPVSAAKATQESVPTELRVVGTVEASAIVQIKSQISGPLLRVSFTEGQNVAEGDLLFEIDPRPFEEALRQAEANVTRDRAQIDQMEADAGPRRRPGQISTRATPIATPSSPRPVWSPARRPTRPRPAPTSPANPRAPPQAAIESAKAALESDLSAVGTAKLNLSYCRDPLAALRPHRQPAGPRRQSGEGQRRAAGDHPPGRADLRQFQRAGAAPRRGAPPQRQPQAGRARVSAQDAPDRAAAGTLSVIDNTVDTATGTIHLKATFDNQDGMLWPGQFVTAVLTLDTIQGATTVPAEAVQAGQQGQFIYVVKPDNTRGACARSPSGRAFGNKLVIEKGIAPGDTVVTDGQLRLFPGAQVQLVDPAKLDAGKS